VKINIKSVEILMADLMTKLRKTLEESINLARDNASNFKGLAEEYGKAARLKFEIHQLKTSRKKKITLLGETVYPFLLKNDFEGLKKHETLGVLIDDIKILNNEIELTENAIKLLNVKDEEQQKISHQELQGQILELEDQIETRIKELKMVKEALETKDGTKSD